MTHIAIVDDEREQISQIKEIVEEFFQIKNIEFKIHEFISGEDLLRCESTFDLVFLDIHMNGIDGIKTAQKLRTQNRRAALLYVTNYVQEMSRSFSVHPFAFVEKPINKEKININLQDYLDYASVSFTKKMLTFKGEHGNLIVFAQDIIYLEYIGNRKIKMMIDDNEKMIYGSMKQFIQVLEPYDFIQTHESFIINEAKIRAVHPYHIIMSNYFEIPIAQKKRKQIVEQVSSYLHRQLKEGL